MESNRTILFIGLLLVSFLLFQEWNNDYNQPVATEQSANTQATTPTSVNGDTFVPASSQDVVAQATAVSRNIITVKTDVFEVKIDTKGGDIIETKLLKFEEEQGNGVPFLLLGEFSGNQYFSQSGLIGLHGPDASAQGRPVYHTESTEYALSSEGEIRVPMTYNHDGVSFTKVYVFKKGAYDVGLEYKINNATDSVKQVQLFNQIKRTVQETGGMLDMNYLGAAYGTEEEPYEKYDFEEIKEKNLNVNAQGGYISFIQHYFVSAWVPNQAQTNNIYSTSRNNAAIIGVKGPLENIAANSQHTISATYYMGPKNSDALEALQPDLDLTVDYGWLWFISQPLYKLLMWLYGMIGNLGLAIIAITIIVKTLLYPLTKAQYTSMAKMRNLQPKIMALKDKHGDDRQKFGQAMMELYRKEKVNPMGGCFPLLLQMPIFLGLYYVFMESVEIRHAEFGLWLTDLSAMDPYFVLPILFGASMFLMQKLQPMTVTDPMQQKMMTYMPVIFSVFFVWFPSGLVLYWLVSNLISIAQMLIIYKGMEKKGISVKAK